MTQNALIADHEIWLTCFQAAADRAAAELRALAQANELAVATGNVGAGGDETLVLDDRAEALVLEELQKLPPRIDFHVITEERGALGSPNAAFTVLVDPVDGSLNAKRGLGHSSMSIAVAAGPRMTDVALGFVHDFATSESFYAAKGLGAFLNGQPIAGPRERRTDDGRLELLCIETSDASAVAAVASTLAEEAFRWRIFGSIANAMCQAAAGRVDAMINVSPCRIIDAAAGALIVEEAGGAVAFSVENPDLSLHTRTRLATASTLETANRLLRLVA